MIFVETSAFVTYFLRQGDDVHIANAIENSNQLCTGTHVRLETCMVLSSRLNITPEEANERFDLVMKESSILMLPLTDAIAVAAVSAFQVYGKGRNSKAKLNLADCFSYAFAKSNGFRLLYVGDDLSQTDIRPA